ncbi:testis-specific Y-encoded protein 3-like [Moschus berezovskii]|uniref:testis-specific Y-encoded protein 3-like n=1 Tax=Moschus berezovskii TaxID=68408 RepID=UPI002444B0BA|nr:testis-specific Y-encoded protein 3-like [Moschus berezovskii]
MESETGPEEFGSSPGSWSLVVSPSLYGAGALGPVFLVGEAEAMQVPGGTSGEEAALFRVEAVEKAAALEEGEVARIGQQFQLLVEVANEEPDQVSSEEREGKPEEQGQEHPRAGALSDQAPLEALAALQVELDPVNKKAQRAHSRLKDKNCQRRKLHLERRSAIIQGIRGFWVKVFINHPRMSVMMSEQDKDILKYMTNLKVEDIRHPTLCCKITLSFRKNRYFQNEVIVKEYLINITGYRASHSTPIQWHQRFERKAYSHRHHNSGINFFNWFFDHNFAGSGKIAEIIVKDLWPDPLQYYMRRKAPPREVLGGQEVPTFMHRPPPAPTALPTPSLWVIPQLDFGCLASCIKLARIICVTLIGVSSLPKALYQAKVQKYQHLSHEPSGDSVSSLLNGSAQTVFNHEGPVLLLGLFHHYPWAKGQCNIFFQGKGSGLNIKVHGFMDVPFKVP